MPDNRNVIDDFKDVAHDEIVATLDQNGVGLEIAIENLERDFNMGSIIRSANAFGVRNVHVIGRRQWNKRGAMATDKYLHVHYYESIERFNHVVEAKGLQIVAVDNIDGATDVSHTVLVESTVLIFGSEANGISDELRDIADMTVMIKQRGSTRSLNVAAAAAVAMYEWSRQHP